MTILSLAGVCFALVALAGMVKTVVDAVRHRRLLARARPARGKIVMFAHQPPRGRPYYEFYPIVRFTTDTGREVEFQGRRSVHRSKSPEALPSHMSGQSLDVLYDPERPQQAVIRDEPTYSFVSFFFFLAMFVFSMRGVIANWEKD